MILTSFKQDLVLSFSSVEGETTQPSSLNDSVTTVEELAEHQPQITAMAERIYQGEPISMFISFSGTAVEDARTDYFQVVDVSQTELVAGGTGFKHLTVEGFLTYFQRNAPSG